MPSAPEVSDGFGNVRIIEVLQEVKAQHFAKADCHIGVAAEVEVDLEGKAYDAEPCRQHRLIRRGQRGNLFIYLTDIVGQQYFLGKSADEPSDAFIEFGAVNGAVIQLFGDIGIAYNWSGNQLRKHRDIGTEGDQTLLRVCFSAVQVNRIGHRLERIEADADRKTQSQLVDAGEAEQVQIADKEVIVFEEAQKTDIEDHAPGQNPAGFLPVGIPVFCNGIAEDPVDDDGRDHDQYIDRFAPAIEEQTGNQQPEVPPSDRHKEINRQDNRQIGK